MHELSFSINFIEMGSGNVIRQASGLGKDCVKSNKNDNEPNILFFTQLFGLHRLNMFVMRFSYVSSWGYINKCSMKIIVMVIIH